MRRFRKETESGDGLLEARPGSSKQEGQARATSRAAGAAPREIHERDGAGRREAARVVERDARTHGVSDDEDVVPAQPGDERLEVQVEGAHSPLFGVGRVAVTAEVERVDGSPLRERGRDVVPPVRIGAAAMKEDERRRRGSDSVLLPDETIQLDGIACTESDRSAANGHDLPASRNVSTGIRSSCRGSEVGAERAWGVRKRPSRLPARIGNSLAYPNGCTA